MALFGGGARQGFHVYVDGSDGREDQVVASWALVVITETRADDLEFTGALAGVLDADSSHAHFIGATELDLCGARIFG